jgi:hypothetical protein
MSAGDPAGSGTSPGPESAPPDQTPRTIPVAWMVAAALGFVLMLAAVAAIGLTRRAAPVSKSTGVVGLGTLGNPFAVGPGPSNNTAAQANLQTALTGADTYYVANNQSYSGLDSPSSTVSDIAQIDTGLSYIKPPAPSTDPSKISIAYSGNGGWVVLTAYATDTHDCWAIVDLKKTPAMKVAGLRADAMPGTYYAVKRSSPALVCVASRGLRPDSKPVQGGFPSG